MKIQRQIVTNQNDEEVVDSFDQEQVELILGSELIRRVLKLPRQSRAKLLAFLHLVEDSGLVECDLQADKSGDIKLAMFRRTDAEERRRSSGPIHSI